MYLSYPSKKGELIMSESGKNWESSLIEGEQLKWQGRPTATGVIDPANKAIICTQIVIGIAWIIWSLIYYLPQNTGIISFVIIDLVPFFLILMPILNARTIKKTSYAISDQRVLVDLNGQEYYMPYDESTEVKKTESGTILIGAAVSAKPSKERHLLLFKGVMNSQKDCIGIVLYTPDDPDGAYKALTKK